MRYSYGSVNAVPLAQYGTMNGEGGEAMLQVEHPRLRKESRHPTAHAWREKVRRDEDF